MGHFIFKFLKELNSATSSKMITLALVLGLMAGFLPTVNFFTFLIFFIVLIFRIPVGLFLASFSVFEIAGHFLDSVFHKTGLFLLNSSFLKPLWTFLYNLPIFRWSGFNNSIVMGSLVLGIVCGIVFYFILNRLIQLYREVVFEKLKKNRLFSWLVPDEKKGVVRVAGVGAVGVVIVAFVVFVLFGLNPLVKNSLEFALSKITHKKVFIESVDTSIKNLSVDIKNMQIGDMDFERVYTKLNWNKLLWKKYQIDDLEVIASTNKNIFDFIKKEESYENKKNGSKLNINIKLPNPNTILAKENLKSLKALEKLKKDYRKITNDLNGIKLEKYKKEFNILNKELKSLEHTSIKSPADLENLIAKIDDIKKRSKNLLKEIRNNKNLLLKDKKLISMDLKEVKKALKEDEENIKSKYEMVKNKEYLKFAQTVLKPEIAKYVKVADDIYQKIKPYIHKENKEQKEYTRAKGIYVKFEDKTVYPDFVLIKSLAKLKTSIAKWSIRVSNLSDNQLLLDKEALFKIEGKSRFFDVGSDISYLNEIKFTGYGDKIKLTKLNMNIADLDALLSVRAKGIIKNKNINAKILAFFNNPKFYNLNKNVKKVLGDLKEIKKFKVIVDLKGKIDKPLIKINSDLDNIFSKILQKRVNALINKKRIEAQKLLNQKVNKELKNINLNGVDVKLNEFNSFKDIQKVLNKKASNIIKSKRDLLKKKTLEIIKSKKDLLKKKASEKVKKFLHF